MNGWGRRLGVLVSLLVLASTMGCTGGSTKKEEAGGGATPDGIRLKGWIYTSNQTLEVKNIGTEAVDWDGYTVRCNGSRVFPAGNLTAPGDRVDFDYLGGTMVPLVAYEVKVVENENRTVVWRRDLTAVV